jgi:hypothetical protein
MTDLGDAVVVMANRAIALGDPPRFQVRDIRLFVMKPKEQASVRLNVRIVPKENGFVALGFGVIIVIPMKPQSLSQINDLVIAHGSLPVDGRTDLPGYTGFEATTLHAAP